MKSIWKKWVSLFLLCLACLICTGIPAGTAQAASQKITAKSISKSKFVKVKNSVKGGMIQAVVENGTKSQALLKTTAEEEYGFANAVEKCYLILTTNGKTAVKKELVAEVRKQLNLEETVGIAIQSMTCIKGTYYITGAYDTNGGMWMEFEGNAVPFLITTTKGSDLKVTKLSVDLGDGVNWRLSYANGYYVASNENIIRETDTEEFPYYISKDLKKWTRKKLTPTYKEEGTNPRTIVFNIGEGGEKEMIVKESLLWWYYYDETGKVEESKYRRTTDFKTFKDVTTLNKIIKNSGTNNKKGSIIHVNDLMVRDGKYYGIDWVYKHKGADKGFKLSDVKVIGASSWNKHKVLLSAEGSWDYGFYSFWGVAQGRVNQSLYLKSGSKNYFYYQPKAGEKFTKYTTKLDASKISSNGESKEAKWSYRIYDKKYLLVSKDYGKSMYKISTGLKNIETVTQVGSNLVLHCEGGYSYYIPVATVQKAAK